MKLRKFESKSKIRGKGKYLKERDSNVAVRLFKIKVLKPLQAHRCRQYQLLLN